MNDFVTRKENTHSRSSFEVRLIDEIDGRFQSTGTFDSPHRINARRRNVASRVTVRILFVLDAHDLADHRFQASQREP